jgi:hypothetical protein
MSINILWDMPSDSGYNILAHIFDRVDLTSSLDISAYATLE